MGTDDLKSLLTSGGYGLATLALSGAVYLYRKLEEVRRELVDTIKADAAAQRELLQQTIPLSTKLADGTALLAKALDAFERVSSKCRHAP
jgi:hypothetical protein